MTEDLLAEQSEVLTKLGTSAEGTHLRARMQSACLLSDMESFKAANPGCVLEDFVRWYSPRDYVEEEVVDEKGNTMVTGTLSPRMKIPGSMWVEAWETARVTPARRQKRLFDDTKEAEKVLRYMAMQKPADLARHLLPCILHATIQKLKEEESAEDIPSVQKTIQQATVQASKLLQSPNQDYKKLEVCELPAGGTRGGSDRSRPGPGWQYNPQTLHQCSEGGSLESCEGLGQGVSKKQRLSSFLLF
ncbi:rab3 GTPase-activating protein catalytic subunit-like isoform X2 [Simochromis diagramma]|uniref:rab3 GTPase-activating protein catalytic subunit-like isoform X2 n=1 Tax=Simochromis diagramma TaxID=43689 RepID=UPI001A7EA4BE|nr:rab3 GTPase-activating protein catalytic subunit-like isoform X2 [Simochromis diagramma]